MKGKTDAKGEREQRSRGAKTAFKFVMHPYTPERLHYFNPSLIPFPLPRQKGLTLIELVLVIGIIALLVGIIWAGLSPIREKGRQAVCMSNLKQIGVAFAIYVHDYNGIYPALGAKLKYWQLGLPPGVVTLHLTGYIKDFQVFLCPSRFMDEEWCPVRDTWKGSPRRVKKASYLPYYWEDVPTYPDGTPVKAPFDEMISLCPEWPVVRCRAHGFFYGKHPAFHQDHPYLGVFIPSWNVRWYTQAELSAKIARERARQGGWLK